VAIVVGKGRRERAVPFGRKTAVALDRSALATLLRPPTLIPRSRATWVGMPALCHVLCQMAPIWHKIG
jgi:hypothetical protein